MGILAFGYGCDLADCRYVDDWGTVLYNALPKGIKADIDQEWNDGEKESYDSIGAFLQDYAENSFDYGFEEFLADVINEAEFDDYSVFCGKDLIIYATPLFPETDRGRNRIPLKSEVETALRKWVGLVAENSDEIEMGYQYFEEL